MPTAVKRVYEKPAASDGVRVLVDRLWPRGLTKEAAAVKFWLRDLAPSTELRQWFHANPDAWRFFRKRYLKELVSPKASAALEKLYSITQSGKRLTLLYASQNEEKNNATVLKELLDGARDLDFRLLPGGELRLPIHDEQHEDERTHRTEQHSQEREGRDFQLLSPSSHAAFPVGARADCGACS